MFGSFHEGSREMKPAFTLAGGKMDPFVTIIVPCFNEEKYIRSLLDNILEQDYPSDRYEVFVIDGMSIDHTREIIEEYSMRQSAIRLLLNEKRFVPFALNLGIRQSKGEVIIRLDAHSRYPANYISRLVGYLFELNADNVGGVWDTKPANDSPKATSIAIALSSVFGVGDSHYRLGVKEVRKVDTVPFGCFRKDLFDRIGLFDEELLRNQDDELNARIIENGGTIYLIPDIIITYYARPDIGALTRMFYQYAFFKPLVNRKLKKPATVRQFIPPLFVLFLFFGWMVIFISPGFLTFFLIGIGLYLLFNIFFTFKSIWENGKKYLLLYLPWIFFFQHMAYGLGYIVGIINFVFIKKSQTTITTSR
ncbi:MAG: glycosyltransferase family 2 protein [Bacteroidales bacterium]|jgi:glycosyltransferase involved in cell wall biosynthesis|nr:glycosyltransferase family 2 protein [Bacteroidales bacterium]